MGQVSVVLPDPIESPAAAPVAPAEADDLLSQMAGEQIDRMLAEADVQRNPPEAGSGPSGGPTTVSTSGGSSTFQGSVPIGADEPSGASADAAASAASPAPSETSDGNSAEASSSSQTAQLSDQLDELFATMSEDHSAGTAETAEQDAGSASSAAERAALNGSASTAPPTEKPAGGESPAEAPVESDESAANTDAIDAADAAVPIYLRVLQWLNAPMATCPQRVREAIGKIAILTLVNAMAVIFYILIFRRH